MNHAKIVVDGVPFDYSLKNTNLNFIELKDGIQEEEAMIMNMWVAAFFDTYGVLPDREAMREFISRINRSGRASYSHDSKTKQFSGRSPYPLQEGQLRTKAEPEPETERPDPAQLLRQAQSLIMQALAEIQ